MADVIETIGVLGTHATPAAWFAAHNAKDMVALGNRYIGELIDPVYEVDAGTLAALNTGTRSSTRYRWLRAREQNQINRITANATPATAGQFTLSVYLPGVALATTSALNSNVTAANVQTALEALVGVGNVTCAATTGANLGVANAVVSITWQGVWANAIVALTGSFASLTPNPHVLSTFQQGMGTYKPERDTGPRIYVRWTGSGDQAGIRIDTAENFFRMSGFALICEDPQEVSGGNKYAVQVQGDDFLASRMFVRISEGGQRASLSAPIFYCYYVQGTSTGAALANNAVFLNCIAYGSRFYKGAHFGFYYDANASNGGCYNCAAYSIRHQTTGTNAGFAAFTGSTVKPRLVNSTMGDCLIGAVGLWESIALDPANVADPLAVDEPYQCADTGYTLPIDLFTPHASANLNGVDARVMHQRPEVQDMRPPPGSVLFRNGRNMSNIWTAYGGGIAPEDFDGNPRPSGSGTYLGTGWTIGPYHSPGSVLVNTAPIVEVKSIGSAGGRDYATVQAFLDATSQLSLVYWNRTYIGELYPDSDFSITAGQRVIARRTIGDGRHYRSLRPAAGLGWDPISGIGVKITGTGGSTTGENNLVEIHEDRFKLQGPMLVEQTVSGAADRRALKVQGNYVDVDAVFGKLVAGTGTSNIIFLLRGSRGKVTNCIAKGSNSAGVGANTGFNLQNCEFTRVLCCDAWGVKGNGSGYGFREGTNTDRVEVSTCRGLNNTVDFSHVTATNAPKVQGYNISSDATADGIGSQRSVVVTSVVKSPSADDFRHVASSTAIKRGRNLSVRFSADYTGAQRYAPFDIGAYEGLPPGPLFRAPVYVANNTARADGKLFHQTLWEIWRKDGVVITLSDQPEPVLYRGRVYDVGGGFVASNRRAEPGKRSVGVRMAFNSSKINAPDLAAQRYRGARLREILLGQHAWTQPLEENVYLFGEIEYDADFGETELSSLSSLLERNAGRLINVPCGLRLGDEECTVDLTPNTLDDVRVASVIDPRRKFNANTADVSVSYVNDYFGKGKLVVLTGLNVGMIAQVKSYVASTRTFELEEALPYDLAVNDTFIVEPGCRLRYILDCIGKHANGINYGGEPFLPGTDRALSTPQR